MPGVPRGRKRRRTSGTRTSLVGLALGLAGALGLSGCGGKTAASIGSSTIAAQPPTVDVYSSLPLQGAASGQASAIVHGIQLALAQSGGHAGRWTVDYRSLDDSTSAAGGWDPNQTTANANQAAADPKAVYFIGDLDSAASELSIPILSRAGIAQVSPGSPYAGLTSAGPESAPGEPARYYPTGVHNFMRLAPADPVEAAAGLMAMRQAGCRTAALADDGQLDGKALARALTLEQGMYGVAVGPDSTVAPGVADVASYAASLKTQDADCFYFAGGVSSTAVQLTAAVHEALPHARIFGGSALCTGAYTSAALGGVPASIAPLVKCTLPTPDLDATPAGRAFLAAYRARFGAPDPMAAYGYEAMKLALGTIAHLGRRGESRAAVLRALVHARPHASLLGRYSFRRDGDTTLRSYSIYGIGPGGMPRFLKTVTPPFTTG